MGEGGRKEWPEIREAFTCYVTLLQNLLFGFGSLCRYLTSFIIFHVWLGTRGIVGGGEGVRVRRGMRVMRGMRVRGMRGWGAGGG